MNTRTIWGFLIISTTCNAYIAPPLGLNLRRPEKYGGRLSSHPTAAIKLKVAEDEAEETNLEYAASFRENSSDSRVLEGAWAAAKRLTPGPLRLITGAWAATDGDANPGGALYNMVFVRVPVICLASWYTSFTADGRSLAFDFGLGGGSFDMPQFIPFVIFALILL